MDRPSVFPIGHEPLSPIADRHGFPRSYLSTYTAVYPAYKFSGDWSAVPLVGIT
ncbi:Uncharacterised protein [uncultured archaeon]|nr:Uncharacterised protein [uncultured archaeon]